MGEIRATWRGKHRGAEKLSAPARALRCGSPACQACLALYVVDSTVRVLHPNRRRTGGALTAETTALNRQVSAINDKMSSFETRMTAVQARLTAQYTGLNATLQKFGTTSSFLSSKFSG